MSNEGQGVRRALSMGSQLKLTPHFGECYSGFGCETKTGMVRTLSSETRVCLATCFKRSGRELSIDMAEHQSIFKNYHNGYHPRLGFTPKKGIAFHKTGGTVFTG